MGLVVIEVLACSVSVIGMNTLIIKEYVIDRKTEYLFENGAESCIKSILSFCYMNLDNRNKIKVSCRNKAMKYSKEVSDVQCK